MNPYQAARQLQYLLLASTWADSPGEYVFGHGPEVIDGSVRLSEGLDPAVAGELRVPFALVTIGTKEYDPEEPGLVLQDFEVILVQSVLGDPFGERILSGANRGSSGAGGSDGRGILELEERVENAIGKLTGANGARAVIAATAAPPAVKVERSGDLLASRKYVVRAWCTRAAHFEPPLYLAFAGGTVSWTLPPSRWDLLKIVLRFNAGSTPPTGPTDGTGVTLASNLATSVAGSAGRAYAVFAAYDETGSGNAERYSDASFSTTVVT